MGVIESILVMNGYEFEESRKTEYVNDLVDEHEDDGGVAPWGLGEE